MGRVIRNQRYVFLALTSWQVDPAPLQNPLAILHNHPPQPLSSTIQN
jgi:hypothetical protein